jgi:hypothetical protein
MVYLCGRLDLPMTTMNMGESTSISSHSLLSSSSKNTQRRPRVKFLLGIFTMDKPFDRTRRDAIRKTYLKFYDSAYEAKGRESVNKNRICSLQDLQKGKVDIHDCQIAYTFVVGANPEGPTDLVEMHHSNSSYPLVVEHPISQSGNTLEDDVTYLNMKENMNQGKTPSWFQYAATVMDDYPSLSLFDYIGKLDTDTLLYIPKFLEMVEQTLEQPYHPRHNNNDQTRVYGGTEMLQTPCDSVNVDSSCKPPNALTYMSGQFYFLSPNLVQYVISQEFFQSQRNELRVVDEDYSMGRWVHSHPLPIHSVSFRQAWAHSRELKYPKEFVKQWRQFQYWWYVTGKRGAYAAIAV